MVHVISAADSHRLFSFLDDVDRVVARDYEPSDQDVVKARLRTVGIQEYQLSIPGGECSTRDARIMPTLTTVQVVHKAIGFCMTWAARGPL